VNIDQLHTEACERGDDSYADPATGYRVFTALKLQERDKCCGCGCRHCPYGHELVPAEQRAGLRQDPWLETNAEPHDVCDVLSWSGGKDSFLALVEMAKESAREVTLMTTFDGRSGQVAHQEVNIADIRAQARQLSIDLLLTPLYPDTPYLERVETALKLLAAQRGVKRMAFGDLHLEHIRQWRLDNLGPALERLSISPHFPIWNVPYADLEASFFSSGASAALSAVADEQLARACAVGDAFTPSWLAALPEGIDRFGENGEFHTLVRPPAAPWQSLGGQ
jgi:diphthamide synthase (EF-2-diphthine--ammonia ligase)